MECTAEGELGRKYNCTEKKLGALATGPPTALLNAPSLAATVENYDVASNVAEGNCKPIDFEMDLERDQRFLGRLTCMALKEVPPGLESGALRVQAQTGVPMRLRQRVVTLLQRSNVKGIGSRDLAPFVVHLVSQCLRDHERVQAAALQLGMVLAENVEPECLEDATAVILREVEAVFWPDDGVISMGPSTDRASSGGRGLTLAGGPQLAATVENYDVASNVAEGNCKPIDFEMDLERDQRFLGRLTCMALKEVPPGLESGALRVQAQTGVPMRLRQRVVTLLQRSNVKGIGSRDLAPFVVHLVSQCLRDHERVQAAALQLGMVLAENVEPECLEDATAVILREVEAVFWPDDGVISMGPSTDRASSGGRGLTLAGGPQLLRHLNAHPNATRNILEGLSGFVS